MIILFNKPFGVICQFSPDDKHPSLSEFIDIKNVYAAGRLDHDSEGLLILTDDGKLQSKITEPKNKLPKTYWVQVEKEITEDAINQLKKGVKIKSGMTQPAEVRIIEEPKALWKRTPPIRYRKEIPTSWIEVTISEGKNRQVRRMTAAVGFPTLRLIRIKIGDWNVHNIELGRYKILTD